MGVRSLAVPALAGEAAGRGGPRLIDLDRAIHHPNAMECRGSHERQRGMERQCRHREQREHGRGDRQLLVLERDWITWEGEDVVWTG